LPGNYEPIITTYKKKKNTSIDPYDDPSEDFNFIRRGPKNVALKLRAMQNIRIVNSNQ